MSSESERNSSILQETSPHDKPDRESRSRSPLDDGRVLDLDSCKLLCIICVTYKPPDFLITLRICKHIICRNCVERYLREYIINAQTDIECMMCPDAIHPNDIEEILDKNSEIIRKYEKFMVRRFLRCIPDSRWCPGPDCNYAVIATGSELCPKIQCLSPGCEIWFCFNCKTEWLPNHICDAEGASQQSPTLDPTGVISQHAHAMKGCPRCKTPFEKKPSCNHMDCPFCGLKFCWICMNEVNDQITHFSRLPGCGLWDENIMVVINKSDDSYEEEGEVTEQRLEVQADVHSTGAVSEEAEIKGGKGNPEAGKSAEDKQ